MNEGLIRFHYLIKDNFRVRDASDVKLWLTGAIVSLYLEAGDIGFIFCDDKYLLEINRQYLKHDYFTDIITFNYRDENVLNGDIFISVPRVRENSKKYNTTFRNELHRVMIHGVLHLSGYDDSTPRQKAEMTDREDYYLNLRRF